MNHNKNNDQVQHDLQDDLWLHVFQFLPPLELLLSVALVQKSWAHHLIQLPSMIMEASDESHTNRNETIVRNDETVPNIQTTANHSGTSSQSPAWHFWRQYYASLLLATADSVSKDTTTDVHHNDNNRTNNNAPIKVMEAHFNAHQWQLCSIYAVAKMNQEEGTIEPSSSNKWPSCIDFGSLLISQEIASALHNALNPDINPALNPDINPRTTRTTSTTPAQILCCWASTTDHPPTEQLYNTLSTRIEQEFLRVASTHTMLEGTAPWTPLFEQPDYHEPFLQMLAAMGHRDRWWSSRASAVRGEEETQETLLFTTNAPICLVQEIAILPLLDPFTRDRVYSWDSTSMECYCLPDATDTMRQSEEDDLWKLHTGHPCTILVPQETADNDDTTDNTTPNLPERLLQGHAPVHQVHRISTQPQPINDAPATVPSDRRARRAVWEHHSIPVDKPVVANVIKMTLHGKHKRQFPTSGYFACVERVVVRGIPLRRAPPGRTVHEDRGVETQSSSSSSSSSSGGGSEEGSDEEDGMAHDQQPPRQRQGAHGLYHRWGPTQHY